MAKQDELKLRRDADRRTGLLALAADRTIEKQGKCLSSSEMSDLLDDRCTESQRQVFFTHLSSCDSCYKEWLELQLLLAENSTHPKKILFFRRKFLAVSGSLLAATASVVFYLNLNQGPVLQKTVIQPVPVPQLESTQPLEAEESSVRQKTVEKPAPPVSVKKKLKQRGIEVQSDSVQENRMDAFSARTAAPAAVAPDPVQLWLNNVQASCSDPEGGLEKWIVLSMQGQELSPTTDFQQLQNVVEQVEKLVQGQDQALVCTTIMKMINEKKD